MTKSTTISQGQSKGAAIFRKMLEDKNAIGAYLKKGGRISDLKDQYSFVKPLPVTGK
jgi:hypothetical protein